MTKQKNSFYWANKKGTHWNKYQDGLSLIIIR